MFGKVKQFLGFVGIDVAMDINTSISKSLTAMDGKITVSAKAAQHITSIRVSLYEEYTTRSGDNDHTQHNDMGKWEMTVPFDISEGETKEFPFTLEYGLTILLRPVHYQEGVMGALAKVVNAASNPDASYYVTVVVDVKGAALDPTKSQRVYFVD